MAALMALLVAVGMAGGSANGKDACSRTERFLTSLLESAQFEKEPEGSLQRIFEDATDALRTCPEVEGLAYVRVRSAELGGGMLVGEAPPGGVAELRRLAGEAAERFPRSARILTMAARVGRDEGAARRAVELDPGYLPARAVLADILVDRGGWREAERVLGDGRGLDATSDGLVVLARVQLAKGDARRALATANRALKGRKAPLVEPDARDPRPLLRAREVARAATEALRSREAGGRR